MIFKNFFIHLSLFYGDTFGLDTPKLHTPPQADVMSIFDPNGAEHCPPAQA